MDTILWARKRVTENLKMLKLVINNIGERNFCCTVVKIRSHFLGYSKTELSQGDAVACLNTIPGNFILLSSQLWAYFLQESWKQTF